jgi:hypothetical protein
MGMSQGLQIVSILEADSLWRKEIIKLPVEWAPNITINGFEELRFASGWSGVNSDQFWSYALAWDIKATAPLPYKEIELNLENYFDGLMKPNHWAASFPEPLVLFIKPIKQNTPNCFQREMEYFDGFHTGKVMTENIMAEQFYCKETGKTVVVFRISPKALEHPIWAELASIKKKPAHCGSQ